MLPVLQTADTSVARNDGLRAELTGAIDALVHLSDAVDGARGIRACGDLRVYGPQRRHSHYQRQIRSSRLQTDEFAAGVERASTETRSQARRQPRGDARQLSQGRSLDTATAGCGRRKILEQELANEESMLEQAKKALAEQESTRLGNERNYQRVLERLEPYKKKVALHESNIANLRKEMSSLR